VSTAQLRLALTIEDRLRELARSVSLTHSTYYASDQEHARIAKFLEEDNGELGAECMTDLDESSLIARKVVAARPLGVVTIVFAALKLWGVKPFAISVGSPCWLGISSTLPWWSSSISAARTRCRTTFDARWLSHCRRDANSANREGNAGRRESRRLCQCA